MQCIGQAASENRSGRRNREGIDKLAKLVIYLLTPATNFPAGMVDISSGTVAKFATSVVDCGGAQ